jgi:hypothetical protein
MFTRESLDLRVLRNPTERALVEYKAFHDQRLDFGNFPDFQLTPEKGYSAKTVIPVTIDGAKVGDLHTLVFLQYDGTGDTSTYQLGELKIPERYKFGRPKLECLLPRAKTGVICEGMFPLFTMLEDGNTNMFASSLEVLSEGGGDWKGWVMNEFGVGLDEEFYIRVIDENWSIKPNVHLTVGQARYRSRFGDPHSIVSGGPLQDEGRSFQVCGFLTIKDPNNPLLSLANKWAKPYRFD